MTPAELLELHQQHVSDVIKKVDTAPEQFEETETNAYALESQIRLALGKIGRHNVDGSYNNNLQQDYSRLILQLVQLQDLRNGIEGRIEKKENLPNGATIRTYIRDARDRDVEQKPNYSIEAFQILYLHYVRTSLRLAELHFGKRLTNEDFKRLHLNLNSLSAECFDMLAATSRTDFETAAKIFGRYNTYLLSYLDKELNAGKDNFAKCIGKLKDFLNLEDEHFHIVTLSRIDGKEVAEAEIVIAGLTEEQKQLYEQQAKKGWHKHFADGVKEFLDYYTDDLSIFDSHVIPTQLRDELIGLHNAYAKKVLGLDTNKQGEKDISEVLSSFHSATLVPSKKLKETAQEIANSNARQLAALTKGSGIHQISLNSLNRPHSPLEKGDEQTIIEGSRTAMQSLPKEMPAFYSNTAVNGLRVYREFGNPDDHTGAKQIVHLVQKNIQSADPTIMLIKSYLADEKDEESRILKIRAAIRKMPGCKEKELFEHLTELHYRLITPPDTKTIKGKRYEASGNYNAEIGFRLIKIHTLFKEAQEKGTLALLPKDIVQKLAVTVNQACKRGKDRTLATMNYNATRAFEEAKYIAPGREENWRIALANSGHTQFMAGIQGATIGCMSIKKDAKEVIPINLDERVKKALIQPIAEYNHEVKQADVAKSDLEKREKAIEKGEFHYPLLDDSVALSKEGCITPKPGVSLPPSKLLAYAAEFDVAHAALLENGGRVFSFSQFERLAQAQMLSLVWKNSRGIMTPSFYPGLGLTLEERGDGMYIIEVDEKSALTPENQKKLQEMLKVAEHGVKLDGIVSKQCLSSMQTAAEYLEWRDKLIPGQKVTLVVGVPNGKKETLADNVVNLVNRSHSGIERSFRQEILYQLEQQNALTAQSKDGDAEKTKHGSPLKEQRKSHRLSPYSSRSTVPSTCSSMSNSTYSSGMSSVERYVLAGGGGSSMSVS